MRWLCLAFSNGPLCCTLLLILWISLHQLPRVFVRIRELGFLTWTLTWPSMEPLFESSHVYLRDHIENILKLLMRYTIVTIKPWQAKDLKSTPVTIAISKPTISFISYTTEQKSIRRKIWKEKESIEKKETVWVCEQLYRGYGCPTGNREMFMGITMTTPLGI